MDASKAFGRGLPEQCNIENVSRRSYFRTSFSQHWSPSAFPEPRLDLSRRWIQSQVESRRCKPQTSPKSGDNSLIKISYAGTFRPPYRQQLPSYHRNTSKQLTRWRTIVMGGLSSPSPPRTLSPEPQTRLCTAAVAGLSGPELYVCSREELSSDLI